jgi:multisubunit Na+/H+ antiporter MnhB subunit
MQDPRMRRLIGCGFGGAMVAAPFVALLFDLAAGLAVMAIALGATAWLALDAARAAEPGVRRRLRMFAGVNGVVAVVCLVVLIVSFK